jgi:serine/threonine protein kinase
MFAMKVIPISDYNERHKAQVTREINLQQRCKNCPNVVRFKEQFSCDEMQCIVMEYMAGGDLQQYLAQRSFQPVPVDLARSITK